MEKRNSEKELAGKYIRIGVVIAVCVALSAVTYTLFKRNPVSELYGTYPDDSPCPANNAGGTMNLRGNFDRQG